MKATLSWKKNSGLDRILEKLPDSLGHPERFLKEEELVTIEEIRIKAGDTMRLTGGFGEYDTGINVSGEELRQITAGILDYSEYAHMETLCRGFVTINGGHRIGICGTAVNENGKIKTIKNVSSINIRRNREITGCGEAVLPYILSDSGRFLNTVIISPPKCGKTTLLRDIIRLLSEKGFKVSLIDERGEIAAMYHGVPQYDVGRRTDVMNGCGKPDGIELMVRTMSPDVVSTDELGNREDAEAVLHAVSCGTGVLTTVHGGSFREIKLSKIGILVKEGVFERYIFLTDVPRTGTVSCILDREGNNVAV